MSFTFKFEMPAAVFFLFFVFISWDNIKDMSTPKKEMLVIIYSPDLASGLY